MIVLDEQLLRFDLEAQIRNLVSRVRQFYHFTATGECN